LDQYHIWVGTKLGYIYKSVDGGATFTAVESGVIAITTWQALHFSDENNGMAVTAGDVIITTQDGGITWTAVTATGSGADLVSCYMIDANRLWVGTATGRLFYSRDGGTTWTERTGQGFGTLHIYDIEFVTGSDLIGFLISTAAGPISTIFRTIDGGFSWQPLDTPTNVGLNDLMIADADHVFAVGEAVGGHPVVVKVTATS
ncbi:MAG: hypothetical protein LUQ37_05830, partial [Methanoregulaceae archaeon]|nr:hypothetical protein [Methanoregulaceae archaeon]